MKTQALLADLFAYNAAANQRLLAIAATLPEDVLHAPRDYSIGSVHSQLRHTLAVEYWWPHFLRIGVVDYLVKDDYPTLEDVRAKWADVTATNLAYIATLTDEAALSRQVKEDGAGDDIPTVAVAQALMQVLLHSMDHRAQTLAALHDLGATTFEQDYIYHLFGDTSS